MKRATASLTVAGALATAALHGCSHRAAPSPPRPAAAPSAIIAGQPPRAAVAAAPGGPTEPAEDGAARCVLRGSPGEMSPLTVAPRGAAPFQLVLRAVPLSIQLASRADAPARADVAGRVSFSAPTTGFPVALRAAIHPGGADVLPSAGVERLRSGPGGAAVFDARIGPSVRVESVSVPCFALAIEPRPARPAQPFAPTPGADDTLWTPRRSRLVVRDGPDPSAPGVTLRFDRREESWSTVRLERAGHRGGWSRVVLSEADGRVVGWVPDTELDAIDSLGMGGVGSGGGDDWYGSGSRAPAPGERELDARIAIGTPVFAGPGVGEAWGVVSSTEPFKVRIIPGVAWAQIERIPGFAEDADGELTHAWVPSAALTSR